MMVLFSPQRSDKVIEYRFSGETVTAIFEGQEDTFDFAGMPDGEAGEIETTLPIKCIQRAYRKYGILHLVLLRYHGESPSQDIAFPVEVEING
jgi:hypothetical protein